MVPIPDPVTMMKLKKFDDSLGNPSRKMASFNEDLLKRATGFVKDAENVARQKLMKAAEAGTTPTDMLRSFVEAPAATTPVPAAVASTPVPAVASTTATATTSWTFPIMFLGIVFIGAMWFVWSKNKKQGAAAAAAEQEMELGEEAPKAPISTVTKAIGVVLLIAMVALLYKFARKFAASKSGTSRVNSQSMIDFCLANPSPQCLYQMK